MKTGSDFVTGFGKVDSLLSDEPGIQVTPMVVAFMQSAPPAGKIMSVTMPAREVC